MRRIFGYGRGGFVVGGARDGDGLVHYGCGVAAPGSALPPRQLLLLLALNDGTRDTQNDDN